VSRTAPPGENILLLQSRPETVWAAKGAAAAEQKVAAPTARAYDHVFNMLGKRPPEG
jgi:pyruvate,water dikinase